MASKVSPSEERVPLWLDCDPGHDDAFAIVLAAHHRSLHLMGISTVHGNASLDHTTWTALSILEAIGRRDISVHPGAAKPFCRKAVHAPNIHGATGIDGTRLLTKPSTRAVTTPNAILAMRRALFSVPDGTAWLVATGALTNVALLFAIFPEVVGRIKGLSIMGGAVGGGFTDVPMGFVEGEGERFGNHTRWAEFNIYCDPEAAESVFSNPELAAKTTLIPLDLTHQVLATQEVRKRVLYGSHPGEPSVSRFPTRPLFHDLLVFFAQTYRGVFGLTAGPPLHDPIAVAVLLETVQSADLTFDDCGAERWLVDVVTDGLHSDLDAERGQLGRTVVTKIDACGVRIPRGMNVERFWIILDDCIQKAEDEMF